MSQERAPEITAGSPEIKEAGLDLTKFTIKELRELFSQLPLKNLEALIQDIREERMIELEAQRRSMISVVQGDAERPVYGKRRPGFQGEERRKKPRTTSNEIPPTEPKPKWDFDRSLDPIPKAPDAASEIIANSEIGNFGKEAPESVFQAKDKKKPAPLVRITPPRRNPSRGVIAKLKRVFKREEEEPFKEEDLI